MQCVSILVSRDSRRVHYHYTVILTSMAPLDVSPYILLGQSARPIFSVGGINKNKHNESERERREKKNRTQLI